MRPVGSVNGRLPAGGYPEISGADGGFLAGFIEGEGSFTIAKRARGSSYGCSLGVACRADDGPLLAELAGRTRLGSVGSKPARGTSNAQVTWRIAAKADCLRLTEILNRHALRGRKSHDYAIWQAGVQKWIDADPSARRAGRDWTPLAHLKRQLAQVRRFGVATPPLIDDPSGLCGDWGSFLAGFLTAEDHLCLARVAAGSIRPRAYVHVRADDRELLEQLSARTGVGAVYGPYGSSGASPSVIWGVVGFADIAELARILDENPLRGRKQLEYRLWRQAVVACRRRSPESERVLARLRDELAIVRAYSDSRTLGS